MAAGLGKEPVGFEKGSQAEASVVRHTEEY